DLGSHVLGRVVRASSGAVQELICRRCGPETPLHFPLLSMFSPAVETFTSELSPDESPPSGVRYDYGADRTIAPTGLSPVRTAAYEAALRLHEHLTGVSEACAWLAGRPVPPARNL